MASNLETEHHVNRTRAEAVAMCAIAAELHTDVRALVAEGRNRQQPLRRERAAGVLDPDGNDVIVGRRA